MTLDEFRYLVEHQDPAAVVLVVEGLRDARFFSILVPPSQRANTTVIPVGEIELPGQIEGGEKGRALWLAGEMRASAQAGDRVFFFLDADLDRFLGIEHPPQVILSDYSDLESYVLNVCSLAHIAFQFGIDGNRLHELTNFLTRVCRQLKLIRLSSISCGLHLPVNHTIEGRLARYINGRDLAGALDRDRLLRALHSNAASDARDEEALICEMERNSRSELLDEHWFCGKDLVSTLARGLKVTFDEAHRVVMGAIAACLEHVREMPNLRTVDAVLRA